MATTPVWISGQEPTRRVCVVSGVAEKPPGSEQNWLADNHSPAPCGQKADTFPGFPSERPPEWLKSAHLRLPKRSITYQLPVPRAGQQPGTSKR